MPRLYKFQTIHDLGLVLIFAVLISLTAIVVWQGNQTVEMQLQLRDSHYKTLNDANNIFNLMKSIHQLIGNFRSLKNSDLVFIKQYLRQSESLLSQGLNAEHLNQPQYQQLSAKIKKIDQIFLLFATEKLSHDGGDYGPEYKKALIKELSEVQVLVHQNNDKKFQNQKVRLLTLLNEFETSFNKLTEKEWVSYDAIETHFKKIKNQLDEVNQQLQYQRKRNNSLHVSKIEKLFSEFSKSFLQYQNILSLLLMEEDGSGDYFLHLNQTFEYIWQNMESLSLQISRQLNQELQTEIDNNISLLTTSLGFAIFTTLGGMLLILLMAYILKRTLTKRLAILVHGIKSFSDGQYDKRISIQTHDEFMQLADHINEMAKKIAVREFQLNQLNQTLESRIEDRTKELQESRDSAEKANKYKSEFISCMSHEIRTPMNAVIGMLDLMKKTNPTGEQQKLIDIAAQSSQNLLNIINDILDFSKIESGNLILNDTAFSLKNLLDSCIKSIQHLAEEKNIEIKIKFVTPSAKLMLGDSVRIQQILLNLLGNAIKFTNYGYIQLLVKEQRLSPKYCKLTIEIEDTGIGIAPEQQKKLFNEFVQIDSRYNRRYQGTGLGLAIVKRLVKLMKGEISLRSEPGKGSCFTFSIQLQYAETSNHTHQSLLEENEDISPHLLDRKLLLVDDVEINLFVVRNHLEMLGFTDIDETLSGQAALDAVKQYTYDLIFMDCQMPEMDGFEATKLIRQFLQNQKKRQIPIIALTANAFENDRIECLQAGMDDFLSKPVTQQQIAHILKKWL